MPIPDFENNLKEIVVWVGWVYLPFIARGLKWKGAIRGSMNQGSVHLSSEESLPKRSCFMCIGIEKVATIPYRKVKSSVR